MEKTGYWVTTEHIQGYCGLCGSVIYDDEEMTETESGAQAHVSCWMKKVL